MLVAAMLVQAAAVHVAAPPADVSLETRIAIAPVAAAIAEVRAKQAALPPPKDDAETLVRLGALDQAARAGLGKIDPRKLPAADRDAAFKIVSKQIRDVDAANQKALLEMLPPEGWFTIGKYGREASQAAFMIVQHAGPDLWRRFLPVLEPLAAKGEIAGGDYALMYDRLATTEGRPQRYGSQMRCENGRFVPFPTEAPEGIEARRGALGMRPYAEYLDSYAKAPPC
ncbi:DUF6624 domain-containing protein [Phenylobacterium sp.]|uniref:DUF6624 domain-containing protein n=1 Tax=Phenylobacterium sp. TaxID=1871053 RepID=UPI0025F034EB|nr:DUF6624 domain-containing protein [Phenylobacterium sp.]